MRKIGVKPDRQNRVFALLDCYLNSFLNHIQPVSTLVITFSKYSDRELEQVQKTAAINPV